MSMCCIFGVCVPYSSLIPILMMLWRPFKQWFDQYFGATPPADEKIGDKKTSKASSVSAEGDSCCGSTCCAPASHAPASRAPAPNTDAYFSQSNKVALGDDMDFEALVASEHPTCVKFTASWCKPCQQQEPELLRLAGDMAATGSKMRFVTVDVDQHDELFAGLEIVGIPHIRLYQWSEVLHTFTGRSTEALQEACKELHKKME